MKKLQLLSVLLAVFLTACSNNDDNSNARGLQGKWKLVNVSGTIVGSSDDFAEGIITWDFNTAAGTVNVVNNNTDENKQDALDSDNYIFEFIPNDITPESCDEILEIGSIDFGCWSISGQTLTISQLGNDGLILTLKR